MKNDLHGKYGSDKKSSTHLIGCRKCMAAHPFFKPTYDKKENSTHFQSNTRTMKIEHHKAVLVI
jgi:Fe-S-cluster-containing dehydrogenase component